MNAKAHEMIYGKKHPSGADEWFCPVCGRRVVVSWEPKFKKTVLEDGDANASHSGFKAGQQMDETMDSPLIGNPAQENDDLSIDESRLAPWREWLDQSRFDDLWNGDLQ